MTRAFIALGSLLLMANACMGEERELILEPPDPQADHCGRAAFEPYIGQHIDDVPEELKARDLLRILPPGSLITMDMRPDRLNVRLGPDGIILSLRCG